MASKDDRNSQNHYHNKGQEDYAEGNSYKTPNNFLGGVFNREYEDDQNIAYRDGWRNAKEQDK